MCLRHYFLIIESLFRSASFPSLTIKGILDNMHSLPGLTPGQLKFGKTNAIAHMHVFSRFWISLLPQISDTIKGERDNRH